MQSYTTFVPKSASELIDFLSFLIVQSPKFEDVEFPGRNLETVFDQLFHALDNIRAKIGDERFNALAELAARVKGHFEADPDDANGEARRGRQLLHEMEGVLRRRSGTEERT